MLPQALPVFEELSSFVSIRGADHLYALRHANKSAFRTQPISTMQAWFVSGPFLRLGSGRNYLLFTTKVSITRSSSPALTIERSDPFGQMRMTPGSRSAFLLG